MNLRGGWGFVRERTLIVRVQILVKIFLCYPLSQFLPDDDEAASMFTVMVDKEITQHEKKKKATTTGTCSVCFCCKDISPQHRTSGYVGKGFQSTPNVCTANIDEDILCLLLS